MDYGLIAFKRTEESIKEAAKQKFNLCFKQIFIHGITNVKHFVGCIKTTEEKLITLKLNCSENCMVKIYANNNLEFAQNLQGSSTCAIKVNGTVNLEVEFLTDIEYLINASVILIGKFKVLSFETLSLYYVNNFYYLINTFNNQTFLYKNSSLQELLNSYNAGNNKQLVKKYICGVNTLTDFYYLKSMGQLCYLVNSNQTILLHQVFSENSIMCFDSNQNKFIVLSVLNNKLTASFMDLNGVIQITKTINLPNGIYVKNLFQVQNLSLSNNLNYFMFNDVNNNFYLVLCNYEKLYNLSQETLSCISLSVKGENANAYLNDTNLIIEIYADNKVHEIVINNLTTLSKSTQKTYNNLTQKLLLSNTKSVLNFNGFLIENETN